MEAAMCTAAGPERQKWATSGNWMCPPVDGWAFEQVKELALPCGWDLVDGIVRTHGMAVQWHDTVRDGLFLALREAQHGPYATGIGRCVMWDARTVMRPDVVVFDKDGLDLRTLECVPVERVALAVEVVSPRSRRSDRYLKPGMFAEAGAPYFWRVERDEDGLPVVHEFWLHHEAGVYAPGPGRSPHRGELKTNAPFTVELDLRSLVEL
ncbi:Uma2 family endonuclease [Streptomyces sp. NPDC057654]|uniref:Uma2 family endonuclease n=1 Tax=Streptomyces sp. NPDC057654 TaxID=3346196 RepID=UPI00369B0D07